MDLVRLFQKKSKKKLFSFKFLFLDALILFLFSTFEL